MSEIGSSPCPNGGSGPLHKPDLEGIDEHALRTPLQQALQVRLRAGRAADLYGPAQQPLVSVIRGGQCCAPCRAPNLHHPCDGERSLTHSGSCGGPGRASSQRATECSWPGRVHSLIRVRHVCTERSERVQTCAISASLECTGSCFILLR